MICLSSFFYVHPIVSDGGIEMHVTIQKQKKINSVIIIVGLFLTLMTVSYLFLNGPKHYADGLNVELYTVEGSILLGDSTTLQVLVFDQDFSSVENANITVYLNDEYNKSDQSKQKLKHVENGLYETEVQFSKVGNWDVKVSVSKGNVQKEKEFMLNVEKF